MQPLVPLVYHNLPSLYPPSNDTCFTHFLTVPNAPSKTMLEYRCKKEMLMPLMQHAGIELGPHRYDAMLQTSYKLHNTRARGRSRRGTLSKMASFIVDSCRDQSFSLETWDWSKNDRLGLVSLATPSLTREGLVKLL